MTSERPGVDAGGAEKFLFARFGQEVTGIVPIRHGEWSRAYEFSRGGIGYIVRISALREDFEKDRLAARYNSPDLPVPAIVELGAAFDGFYAISERAPGDHLDSLDEGAVRRLLPRLFAALDDARCADLSSTQGFGVWDGDGRAPHASWRDALLDVAIDRPLKRTFGWRARLAASPTGAGPFEEAFERMAALAGHCPEARHLVHSDLLHYNVLVTHDRITAVIDWGSSIYGDFLYDLAWLSFWSPWYPAWSRIDFAREGAVHYESIGLRVPSFAERLRCYELHIGLDGQAYNAFRGDWADLDATARRTLDLARRSS